MFRSDNEPAQTGDSIWIQGAREHNLKNLSLEIPRGKFVVVTGVSGSGKSTLAFDLLFAEGQRRFLDSMNTYARQFIEQLARPDVDLIAGLPPTVSIEQRTSRGGGKSTVATVTEIYQFIRLLFARLGTQYCPDCQQPVREQSADELSRHLLEETKKRGDLLLLAPVVRNRKGFHTDVAEWAAKHGYAEVRADGKMYPTSTRLRLDRFKEHDVEVVIGVLDKKVGRNKAGTAPTQAKSSQQVIDEALRIGGGALFAIDNRGQETVHSTHRVCPSCSRSFEPLDPKHFSYNSSQGWCPKCRGFGELFYIPEVERGANADSIEESWWRWANEREKCPECAGRRLNQLARAVRLDLGAADVRRLTSKAKPSEPRHLGCYQPTIDFFADATVGEAGDWFRQLKLSGRAAEIARDIIPEINTRLHFLAEVGLDYLQLGRSVTTLSGGEAQRIRLAAQLGSNLSGVLYILDEPTIGLHPRDNEQLLAALKQLQQRGNSLVVVEHDEDTMRHADWIVDLGPGAGVKGGEVVAAGTLKQLLRHKDSLTGRTLAAQAEKRYPTRGERRLVTNPKAEGRGPRQTRKPKSDTQDRSSALGVQHSEFLRLEGAAVNNLKDLTVTFPLNRFIVVTGVSGSGKSTLIRECLLPALEHALKVGRGAGRAKLRLSPKIKSSHGSASRQAGSPYRLKGFELLKHVYEVDQSPIGRTPRSTPATYVGFFDDIRELFAQTPEARMRGYSASRFSFNSAQGRCPECQGAGTIKVEMNFLPTAHVKCETCNGLRFTPETLDVEYRGKNIAQVLELSVAEAIEFFAAQSKIRRPLEALRDTGLDYLKIGQTSPTLSGGEAQRVKLVTHLLSGLRPAPDVIDPRLTSQGSRPGSLFILEEPTIGLHMTDVQKLVEVIQRLVDAGHTVIVIEHNLDLIGEADWVIDLGPEGGDGGGRIIAQGPPEEVAKCRTSHTGKFLSRQLGLRACMEIGGRPAPAAEQR